MHENDIHRIIVAAIRASGINVPATQEGHRDGVDELAVNIMTAIDVEGFTFAARS